MRSILLVVAMAMGLATPVNAAVDPACAAYVQMIGARLMHNIRLTPRQRNVVKALRKRGIDTIDNAEACRPPLAQALRMLGINAPAHIGATGKTGGAGISVQPRRVYRLGS